MDQVAFARFVRRAVDNAKTTRGWTVSRLAAETGVGRSTLFRWLSCEGQDFPELASLRGFCAALDIPVASAFAALGVRESEFEEESEAREDMNLILVRLTDPTVPEAEKSVVRGMLRYLAGRPLAADEPAPGAVPQTRTDKGAVPKQVAAAS